MQISLIILGTFLLIAVLYEQFERYKTKKNYPIRGAFVDVGGHALHYVKKGSGDTATILFESGLDFGGHIAWRSIQDKLSQNFTTLAYDRAGILHSQRGTNPKDIESIIKELHTMLEQLDLPKPYIFVGHSLAGIILRAFIHKYPQNVAGIVLLDPTHPEIPKHTPEKISKAMQSFPPKWVLSIVILVGLTRLSFFTKFLEETANDALESEKENYKEALSYMFKSFNRGYIDEILNLRALFKETEGIEFDRIPILLLGATKAYPDKKEYREMLEVMTMLQHKTVENSLNGKYIAVDSGHVIQGSQPNFVVETVERFVKELLKENIYGDL